MASHTIFLDLNVPFISLGVLSRILPISVSSYYCPMVAERYDSIEYGNGSPSSTFRDDVVLLAACETPELTPRCVHHRRQSQLMSQPPWTMTQDDTQQTKEPETAKPTPTPKPKQDVQSPSAGGWQAIFALPKPVKRVFQKFPLTTYAPNKLPSRAPIERDLAALYIFSTEEGAAAGAPSFNPSCLKWQVCNIHNHRMRLTNTS